MIRPAGLPDLVIDPEEVEKSAFIDNQSLGSLTCALEEKCLSDSAYLVRAREPRLWKSRRRKLLRFTNKVQNIGGSDYRPHTDPAQWQWHSCHSHFHSVESFSDYDLTYPGTNRRAAQGHKASFCLEDSECKAGIPQRYRCQIGTSRERFPQGIRAGCADVYASYIDCQWIDVTDLQSGPYTLRVRVNGNRMVAEESFDNNQVICRVRLDLERERTQVSNCRLAPL
ncbi:Protein-lysine 6-oxidase [Amphibalanus amphitrite]|uniref:Protein-lysine 6-oxidase n=1 Tax=Amphibalanus amphitrite TaxID=1232801 RepID=A0A6A4WRU4_AMPAM|nr:Protein-lysine 6-oxidase [Amphibalanus amphitrite]